MNIFGYQIDWLAIMILLMIALPIFNAFLRRKVRGLKDRSELSLVFGQPKSIQKVSYANAPKIIGALKSKEKVVAVVNVDGVILNESRQAPRLLGASSRVTFGLELGNTLRELSLCDNLSAILIRVSTPGGTVPGSDSIAKGVQLCVSRGKLVFVHISDIAASGGVWAMVGATRIIAHPHSIIGSIGVIGPSIRTYEGVTELREGFLGQQSVTAERMSFRRLFAGKGKAFGDPFGERDNESEENFQSLLNDSYEAFIAHVSRFRKKLTAEDLRKIGAGLMNAKQAAAVGLVDQVGDLPQAQAELARDLNEDTWAHLRVFALELRATQGLIPKLMGAHSVSNEAGSGDSVHTLVAQELARSPILALSPIAGF